MFGVYRVFLALMVVAYHLGGYGLMGAYAVFGFYALSGYLMTLIMHKNYGYTLSGSRKYALNRFLRIYPIYWISILSSALLIWALGSAVTTDYHHAIFLPTTFTQWVRNIGLIFSSSNLPRMTPPAWALTIELVFYGFIGIGLSRNKHATVVWFLISVIYHACALYFSWGWHHRYFTVFAASLPFSTGALIYHYKAQLLPKAERTDGSLAAYMPYIFAALIFGNWLLGYTFGHGRDVFFYSNYLLCSCMILILADKKSLPLISKKLDSWIGDFSYPIYLFHYQVGLFVIVLFEPLGIALQRKDLSLLLLSIPFIFLFSWLVSYSVERPIEHIRARIKA